MDYDSDKKTVKDYIRLLISPEHRKFSISWLIGSLLLSLSISGILVQLRMSTQSLFSGSRHVINWGPMNLLYGFASPGLTFFLVIVFSAVGLVFFATKLNTKEMTPLGYIRHKANTHGGERLLGEREAQSILRKSSIKKTNQNILGMSFDLKSVYTYDPERMPGYDADDPDSWYKYKYLKNGHKAVCSGSGEGKTRGIVTPDILQAIQRGESVIATDTSGELYAQTSLQARAAGYNVKVLNLKDTAHSDSANYLSIIYHGDKYQNAMLLSKAIVENTVTGKKDPWDAVAEFLLTAVFLYYTANDEFNPRVTNMTNILKFLARPLEEIEEDFNNLDKDHPARFSSDTFTGSSPNYKGNAYFALQQKLQVFGSEEVQAITTDDEIDFIKPGFEKCVYYICLPDSESTKDFLAAMFFDCLFVSLIREADARKDGRPTEALPVAVNFILDEFQSIGRINDFNKKIATVRRRNMHITIIFQDIGGLKIPYPYEWTSILANCAIFVLLGTSDSEETAEYISNRLSDTTVETSQDQLPSTHGVDKVRRMLHDMHLVQKNVREAEAKRSLMNIGDVQKIGKRGELLLLLSKQYPILLRRFDRSFHPLDEIYGLTSTTEYIPQRDPLGHGIKTISVVPEAVTSSMNKFSKEKPQRRGPEIPRIEHSLADNNLYDKKTGKKGIEVEQEREKPATRKPKKPAIKLPPHFQGFGALAGSEEDGDDIKKF